MARRKARYFAHHWQAIKDCPEHLFPSMPYLQFMDWKINNWQLPSSHEVIIRTTDIETKAVREYSYMRMSFAEKKSQQIMAEGRCEFCVVGHDEITNLTPEELL